MVCSPARIGIRYRWPSFPWRAISGIFLLVSVAYAQAPKVPAAKLANRPTIDGTIGVDEWKEASHLSGFTDPITGKTADLDTEVWIGYDAEAVYVAFYCHDPLPGQIVAREVTPGADFDDEDHVNFRLNTFGTRTWDGRSHFAVNALNTQSEDIAGGRASKREWRGEWQSSVQKVADGWCVEMRIPWRILNYPSASPLNMDIDFERYQARTRVDSRWASKSEFNRPEDSGIWVGVEPPRIKRKTEYLTYIAPETESGKFQLRMGGDVRHSFTPTLTGLLSIAPDFRNIESQVAGIGFTRTERYLDESRPFFNEGRDFFDLTGEHTFGRMFYSRRIDAFDVGAKVYGQATPSLAVGALATEQFGEETVGIARISKTYGPNMNGSVYATHLENGGLRNSAFGANGWARRGTFFTGFGIASEGNEADGMAQAGGLDFAYDAPKLFSILHYEWVQPGFDPPLGYVPWGDHRGWSSYNETGREFRTGPLVGYHGDFNYVDTKTYDGQEQQKGWGSYWGSALRRPSIAFGGGHSENSYYGERESLSNVDFTLNYNNRFRRIGGFYQWGTRGGDPTSFVSVGGSYRLFRKLDLGFDVSHQDYLGTANQTVVTVGYEISPYRSITGRAVNTGGKTNVYLAYRNSGMRGMELYVILGDPNAEETQSRLSVKAVWAF